MKLLVSSLPGFIGNAYNVCRKDTWVAYKNCAMTGLRASDVVVICKRIGRVLH